MAEAAVRGDDRLEAGRRYAKGKIVPSASAKALLEAVIHPGDRSARFR
jgi:hypothetical protein